MRRYQLIALFLLFSLFSGAAPAGEGLQPFRETAFYTVHIGGVTVGSAAFSAYEDDTHYRMDSEARSNGVAWIFTRHSNTTSVRGIKRDGQYLPQRYDSVFNLRGKQRIIQLEYNDKGELVNERIEPEDPPGKRPPIPEELKRTALDGMTPIFVQRRKVYEALNGGERQFTLRNFGGRRLTDLHYTVLGRTTITLNARTIPAIHVMVTRTPVAGYTDKELRKADAKAESGIQVYYEDDARMLPLRATIDSQYGTFIANYRHRCESMEACVAGLN